jgi:uncharacterized protein YoxC
MPVIVQICIVVVTLALVGIALVTMRTMQRFEKAANEFSETADMVQQTIGRVESVVHEFHEIASTLSDVAPRVRSVATRFEEIGHRAANLTDTVLQEVERPVSTAVALMRGVRSGTNHLLRALRKRSAQRQLTNGGNQP